jgi:hypothetical protein
MEEIKITINEIENLVVLLLVQKEKLEERKEIDPSNGSISKTLLAIKQLSKKLDTVLSSKGPKVSEELEMEVCENE